MLLLLKFWAPTDRLVYSQEKMEALFGVTSKRLSALRFIYLSVYRMETRTLEMFSYPKLESVVKKCYMKI